MDKKGNRVSQITANTLEEWGPTWISKNEISFLRQEAKEIKIISLNLRTNQESTIKHPANCTIDDKNILYSKMNKTKLYACNGDVFIEDYPTGTPVNLTKNMEGQSNYLDWVDEQSIIFTNNQTGNNEVYYYNITNKKLKNLTNSPANDERGSISPNGEFLVFSSDRYEKGNQEILLLNLENQEILNISKSEGTELIGRWNKDGKRIYFGSNKDGNWEIYAYQISNQKTTQLTFNDAFDGDPRVY
ncbi:MAG: hypothetical protein Sapg2KO_41320 [Saprospiraceae bacterium]